MDCGSQRLKRWESLPYWAFLGKGGGGYKSNSLLLNYLQVWNIKQDLWQD